MAPPAPAPLPPQSPEEIAAIQAHEDAMDDDEYVKTPEGQTTAAQLIATIAPTAATPRQLVRDSFNALSPEDRRIIKAYLRFKMTKKSRGKKLNNREAHVLSVIGV